MPSTGSPAKGALAAGDTYQPVHSREADLPYARPVPQRRLREVPGVTPAELLAALDESAAVGKVTA